MTLKQSRNLAIAAGVLGIAATIGVQFIPDGLHAAATPSKPGLVRTNEPIKSPAALLGGPPQPALLPANASNSIIRRIPVYVIPELIVIDIGGTLFQCVDPVHVNELAKLFRAYRQTNVVLWVDAP